MAQAPSDAINLALGELGYPLPAILRQKAIELLATETPRYTPNAGLPDLRAAVATYTSVNTSPEQVCVCNGAEEAVFLTLFSFLEPGDIVAIPDPDYTAYPAIVKMLGCKVLRLPHGDDLISIDWDLWESIISQNVRALVISNPRNPSGVFLGESDMARLVNICAKQGTAIVVDEIYRDLCFDGKVPSFAGQSEHLFLVNGLSKSHCMSGWRIGWVVSPIDMAPTLVKAKQYVSTCSNWLSQQLGAFALSNNGKSAAKEVFAQLSDSRDYALGFLESRIEPEELHCPKASPYMMLKCKTDAMETAQRLAMRGVICVPGAAFGPVSSNWIRINYAVTIDKLEKALPEIVNELRLK
jgi:aspartate/methionine/tyrosine aminotransferase